MPSENLLQCYNRGCGQKYDSENNKDDSCRHHPGEPFFHDAYKGWSCCNKKCTDFTEFLNIRGCTLSKHSNVKPPEPEKPKQEIIEEEVIEVKPVIKPKERPPFDSPLKTMVPEIAPALKQQNFQNSEVIQVKRNPEDVPVGTACKNGGCSVSYQGPDTNNGVCIYHPGVPIFHEGMKFWSCCQKKTTDFNAFLNQVGCEQGKHVWFKDDNDSKNVQCRWDYHQTGSHVIVSIYAKQYCIKTSEVKLNPVRLYANLVFPLQNNATFNIDLELRGIIDVDASQINFYGTKVEIKMKKAEPGSWSRLEIPRPVTKEEKPKETPKVSDITPKIDAVDLDDI